MVARLGGDEFALLLHDARDRADATRTAERIIVALSAPCHVAGHTILTGTSVGIAFAPGDETDADNLLKAADLALYRAKNEGGGIWRMFEPEMDTRMQARRSLEIDLRHAVRNNEFRLFYQPIVSLRDYRVTGFEALLRWDHPVLGMVSPVDFIPIAEEIGLIAPIGAWVLQTACADAVGWLDEVKVAVNISPMQFKSRTLVTDVGAALTSSGLPAHRLEVEITETVMLQDTNTTLETLKELRDLGVRIAMDDFGTGYSSLSYLRRFPFNKIKIDQCFIRDMSDEHEFDGGASCGHRTRCQPRHGDHGRGRGDARTTLPPAGRGMHRGPGLLLRQAKAGRRGPEHAARHRPPDAVAERCGGSRRARIRRGIAEQPHLPTQRRMRLNRASFTMSFPSCGAPCPSHW